MRSEAITCDGCNKNITDKTEIVTIKGSLILYSCDIESEYGEKIFDSVDNYFDFCSKDCLIEFIYKRFQEYNKKKEVS